MQIGKLHKPSSDQIIAVSEDNQVYLVLPNRAIISMAKLTKELTKPAQLLTLVTVAQATKKKYFNQINQRSHTLIFV